LQSDGSSATVALASAVIADIVTSPERGSYIGYVSIGNLVSGSFGSVIGGLLAQFLGWRSIFWFLTIFSGVAFLFFLACFPETYRRVVGNGSRPPQRWNHSILSYLALQKQRMENNSIEEALATVKNERRLTPVDVLRVVFEKESGIILTFGAFIFTAFYMVSAALPPHFNRSTTSLRCKLAFVTSRWVAAR
jgi:MFS family permease